MKEIEGYEGIYFVSEKGDVVSKWFKKPKILKTWLIGNGYKMVMLYKPRKKPKKFLVHRLVAKTFVPNPNNLKEVNHLDGNRINNKADNLEWVTSAQNKQHAIKMGLYDNLGKNTPKGVNNKFAKLNDKKVREIRRRRTAGESSTVLSKEFGVSYHLIDLVCWRRVWKHVI